MYPRNNDLTSPPLAQVFVYPARMKFLAVLADDPDGSFSATELADHAGTAPSTWTNHRDELLDLELVETVDADGAHPEYTLATTTHARLLQRLSDELDDVIYELRDPISDAIGGFTR
ncbi:histidine kinase [Haladaptatus sp. R4]|uniref:ArsR/SmtB family transcription factor n=1 Tax=Haladaptatus sp. R4 TaxID=1679489 RepID=UPI0007B45EAA|nr:helix-turn-helix transcriptional regulator [Haladaptatus sp. R4]KZN22865.1 histidine kinase [Haladaptatus sp. R4]